MEVENQNPSRSVEVSISSQERLSHSSGQAELTFDAPEGDSWETARRRLREVLQDNPKLARSLTLLLEETDGSPVPGDEDELIRRARAGEFGRDVFLDWYGEDLAEKLKSTSVE
jgi:hypothetical protein